MQTTIKRNHIPASELKPGDEIFTGFEIVHDDGTITPGTQVIETITEQGYGAGRHYVLNFADTAYYMIVRATSTPAIVSK